MKVGFRLCEHQVKMIIKSIDFYTDILELDWESAFLNLFDWCYSRYDKNNVFADNWEELLENYKESLFVEDSNIDFSLVKSDDLDELNDLYIKFGKEAYTAWDGYRFIVLNLSKNQIDLLLKVLDLPIRISMGQWSELNQTILDVKYKDETLREYTKSVWYIDFISPRAEIINAFNDKFLSNRASFGILNTVLSEDIRTIYDIYKELHYQWNPQGCYDCPPWKLSKNDDPLPMIEFEMLYINDYNEDTIGFWKEFCTKEHREHRKPYYDEDGFFIPIKQTLGGGSVVLSLVKNGDSIYKKLNGYYYLTSAESEPSITDRLLERSSDEEETKI